MAELKRKEEELTTAELSGRTDVQKEPDKPQQVRNEPGRSPSSGHTGETSVGETLASSNPSGSNAYDWELHIRLRSLSSGQSSPLQLRGLLPLSVYHACQQVERRDTTALHRMANTNSFSR
jgi:hypothetical protein